MSEDLLAWARAIGDSRWAKLSYRATRGVVRSVMYPYFRVRVVGAERLDVEGPLILAPVHRSNLDPPLIGSAAKRRVRSLAKESLFSPKPLGAFIASIGSVPIRRGAADREALLTAMSILEDGEAIIVFPEGTRQSGPELGELFDGPAWLAAKTGAPVVPIGVAGTEAALPSGGKFPRPKRVVITVGEPLPPPDVTAGRVGKPERKAYTAELSRRLREVFDDALVRA